MKNIFSIIIIILFLISGISSAASESINNDAHLFCICGRHYFEEDGIGYSRYDCVLCKKNIYFCDCTCWCGHPSKKSDNVLDETAPLICTVCNLECINCICRSRDELEAIELMGNVISSTKLPKPENIINIILSLFLPAFAFYGLFILGNKKIEKVCPDDFNELKKALKDIYQQESGLPRYLSAKQAVMEKREELKKFEADAINKVRRKELVALCFKKDALLEEALSDPWLKNKIKIILDNSLKINKIGMPDDILHIFDLWDGKSGRLTKDRLSFNAKNSSQTAVKWPIFNEATAIYELANALNNGTGSNLCKPASNITTAFASVFNEENINLSENLEEEFLLSAKESVKAILPDCNSEDLLSIPIKNSKIKLIPPEDFPSPLIKLKSDAVRFLEEEVK